MATWKDTTAAAPELAALTRARIEATGMGLLATLRRDGFPRVSGVEPMFDDENLWLGMMPRSRKAADLQRDSRLCLHNATADKDVKDGDVKITGHGIELTDPQGRAQFRQNLIEHSDFDPGDDFIVFTVDVVGLSSVRPDPDAAVLIIDWWREGGTPQRVERT